MMDAEDTAEPDARTRADLSALADGTLDPERAAGVRDRIARSPELTRRFEDERRAVTALHAVRADRAPARVRLAVSASRERTRRSRRARQPRSRLIYVGALGSAVAAAVAAAVLLLPGGAPGAPSVSQAAALALRGPAMSAPARHPGAKLNQDVQEVYFPDWSGLGWHAVGQRIDRLGDRLAVTVYYEKQGRQVAYTILTSPALAWPHIGTQSLHGVELQKLVANSRLIITWRRSGHTCILSGSRVSADELARLAGWE